MELYVKTPTGGYNVLIRRGATEQSETYSGIPRGGKTLIVTDDGVPERYIKTIASRFDSPVLITLPQGEHSKSLENYTLLLKTMAEHEFSREATR